MGTIAAEWVTAVATAATAVILLVTLIYVTKQVSEARELREQQFRPWVVVDFHFRSVLVLIRIKNIGGSAARDLRITMDPPFASTIHDNEPPRVLDGEPIPQLAPNEERIFELDVAHKRFQSDLPRRHEVALRYRAHDGTELPVDRFTLDFDSIEGMLVPDRNMHDLVEELERLRKVVDSGITQALRRG